MSRLWGMDNLVQLEVSTFTDLQIQRQAILVDGVYLGGKEILKKIVAKVILYKQNIRYVVLNTH